MDQLSTLIAQLSPEALAAFFVNLQSTEEGKDLLWQTACQLPQEGRSWLLRCLQAAEEATRGA